MPAPTKGQIIAAAAMAHVGCSATKLVDLYTDVVVRPIDRIGRLHPFYVQDKALSTCALFCVGCWRLAGVDELETMASYFPPGGPERNAFADEENLGRRFGAWVPATSAPPVISTGDAWIIADAQGGDGHTGIAVGDAMVEGNGVVSLDTVEGGQADPVGSTGTGAFTRTLRFVGGRWMMGARFLMGWIRAEALPVPVPASTLPAPPETPGDPHEDPGGQHA